MVSVEKNWGGVEGMNLYTFESKSGLLKAKVTNQGATLVSLQARDKDGEYHETTLGYDTAEEWKKGTNYFGCTVGRYGNRIKHGKFSLDGKDYALTHCNNGNNHLHGGVKGLDKLLWAGEAVEAGDVRGVKFTVTSPDGDNGYPGELTATAWVLLSGDELLFAWDADVKGSKTVLNLTNHTYWNLAKKKDGIPTAMDHVLTVNADKYVEVDAESIPTGKLPPVDNTCFDFKTPRKLADRIDDALSAPQSGLDHALCFADWTFDSSRPKPEFDLLKGAWSSFLPEQGELFCGDSGLGFKMFTTQPAVQAYAANFLNPETDKGYGQVPIPRRGALCLECQHYPDSPNHPHFPSTVLAPGEKYHHVTVHKFYNA